MYSGCNKTYYVQSKLFVHLRMHLGIKPFVCHFCSKSFNEKGNLQTHLRVHTNERPYKCKQCEKKFKTEGQLKEHTFSHIPDKPFKCPYCLHFFKRKGVLKTHMQIHKKDPEYLAKIDFYEEIVNKTYRKESSNQNNNTINSNFTNESSKNSTTTSPVSPILPIMKKDKNVEIFEDSGKNGSEKNIEDKNELNFNFNLEKDIFTFFEKIHTNENDENFMKDGNICNDEIEDINSIEYIDPLNQENTWRHNEMTFGEN